MKLSALILSVCFSMFFLQNARAQKDYIISFNNDTLKGKIKVTLFGKPKFTENDQSKVVSISPKTTKEYCRIINAKDAKSYLSKALPNQSRLDFLELIEKGTIQLCELIQNTPGRYGSTTVTTWYACKGENLLVAIKTSGLSFSRAERRKKFEDMLSDQPELLEKFKQENDFSFDAVKKYTALYNKRRTN